MDKKFTPLTVKLGFVDTFLHLFRLLKRYIVYICIIFLKTYNDRNNN